MDPFSFLFSVCYPVLSVHCSFVVTCWEGANLLATLFVMFSCVFATFLMWYPGSGVVHACIDSFALLC